MTGLRTRSFLLGWLLPFMFCGCTGTKYLGDSEKFYEGAELRLESLGKIPHRKSMLAAIETVLEPEPNEKLLGSRPKVWFYHIAGTPKKEKGFKHWMKYKLGRAPVTMDQVNTDRTKRLLINRLHNSGYFDAEVDYLVKSRQKSARVEYRAQVKDPYRINALYFPPAVGSLRNAISTLQTATLIQKGQNYDFNLLLKERKRIDNGLKNQGFYYFSPDYLLFEVDSTVGDRQVNIFISVKGDIPQQATNQYEINKITLKPNYRLYQDEGQTTIRSSEKEFVLNDQAFRSRVITNSVYFQPGSLYQSDLHQATLSRLIGLGAFKFINVRFRQDSLGDNKLNTEVELTPLLKKSIQLEVDLVASSNNFIGPQFSVNFLNRNTLRGAERLKLNLYGSFETQVNGQEQPVNSFEFGAETGLYLPRFISPFRIKTKQGFPAQTGFELGYSYLQRPRFFTLNSFRFSYGYEWERNQKHRHQLKPVEINRVKLLDTTPEFEELLQENDFLLQSYDEQFILGSNYIYYYTPPSSTASTFSFRGNIDVSGNLANLAQRLVGSNAESGEILGQKYSQFTRLEAEWRYKYQLNQSSQLNSRFLMGVGFSYGNSNVLPYVKQFFAGGSSSIRGFRARSVGPGSYEVPDSLVFTDQGGDVRLEFNSEYRFDLVGIFKGAFFVDMGNIWTRNDEPARPGGAFGSSFLNEIAVATGLGLRVDADFFVFRLDLGIPLRKPFLPDGDRWVIDEIDFGSSTWRQDNLILNVAIGYPF